MQTASTQGQRESIYPTSQAVNTGLYPTLAGLTGIKAQTCSGARAPPAGWSQAQPSIPLAPVFLQVRAGPVTV